MREFKLPDVGEGLAEAELLGWLVAVGDRVEEGQPLVEISTDKVNVEIPAPCDGAIEALPWNVGDVVPVGATLAVIREDGASAAVPSSGPAPAAAAPTPAPTAPAPVVDPVGRRAVVAAPSTRRLAHDLGIDLGQMRGTGPAGRILRADVELASNGPSSTTASTVPAPGALTTGEQQWEAVRLAGMRRTSAERMAESSRTYATSTSTFVARADGLLRLRSVLDDGTRSVGMLAILSRVVAVALSRHPRFNARIDEAAGTLHIGSRVDLAFAVDTEHGLTVPVLRGAEQKSVRTLQVELGDLSARARSGQLTAVDLEGATFTLSSTGAMERTTMVSTTPLISPPQVAIVWLSRISVVPRVTDGVLEAGPMITCSLSFDHRYIDGAELTAMLNELTALLETPERALA